MHQLKSSLAQLKTTKCTWWLLCAFFMLATIIQPAFSAHNTLPKVSMVEGNMAAETVVTGSLQNSRTSHQNHHVGHLPSSPCDEPGCGSTSDCSDSCSMNTCCTASGVFIAQATLVQTNHTDVTIHPIADESSVSSIQSEPAFRPPIH